MRFRETGVGKRGGGMGHHTHKGERGKKTKDRKRRSGKREGTQSTHKPQTKTNKTQPTTNQVGLHGAMRPRSGIAQEVHLLLEMGKEKKTTGPFMNSIV